MDRSGMGFVIISMVINTYLERQEDSPLGPTANSSFRSSFLQQKLKMIKDASASGEREGCRKAFSVKVVGCASPGSQGH